MSVGDGCQISPDGNCATTRFVRADGATDYDNNDFCQVRVNVGGMVTASHFNTEPVHDVVTVGGGRPAPGEWATFFGTVGPVNVSVLPGQYISWIADSSNPWALDPELNPPGVGLIHNYIGGSLASD